MTSLPSAQWSERRAGERTIHIGDGLFDPGLVAVVDKLVAALPLYRAEYDNQVGVGRPHLKHEWKPEELAEHLVLRGIRDPVVAAVERVYVGFEPVLKRVHLNEQSFGDIQGAHRDLSPGVTAIYYANAEWRDEWEGETIFYADGEAVTAVAPRPGRVALFGGDLVHRGGLPSRLCSDPRRTIAFKFRTESTVP